MNDDIKWIWEFVKEHPDNKISISWRQMLINDELEEYLEFSFDDYMDEADSIINHNFASQEDVEQFMQEFGGLYA